MENRWRGSEGIEVRTDCGPTYVELGLRLSGSNYQVFGDAHSVDGQGFVIQGSEGRIFSSDGGHFGRSIQAAWNGGTNGGRLCQNRFDDLGRAC